MKNVETVFGRIALKDWEDVFAYWQQTTSAMSFPIDSFSTAGISQVDRINDIGEDVSINEASSTNKLHFSQIEGIQYKVLSEAVSLFYKSLNAIKSAQCDLLSGLKTWSITNYYESSYLSIKCLLNLFGIHVCRTLKNKDLIIDLFPKLEKRRKAFIECQIHLIRQLEHWELWSLLQRVLRTSKHLPLDEKLLDSIVAFDSKDFARQRNLVIYHDAKWIFDDLKKESEAYDFADLSKSIDIDKELMENEAFTMILATIVSIVSFKLFQSIAESNPLFRLEYETMEKSYSSINNSMTTDFEASHRPLFSKPR